MIKVLLLTTSLIFSLNAFSESPSRVSDKVITPDYSGYERTAPLFELGAPFLETGNIDPGFEIFTGAIWQPQFMIFGDFRTAIQSYDDGSGKKDEWANRLNLFAQLKLSGTERFLASFRPLDKNNRFFGQRTNPLNKTINDTNFDIRSFYFEGEFGEIFPELDPLDSKKLDWGFSIGLQPFAFQEGLLINDNIESLGIVRNSITLPGISNLRVTGVYGWNDVNRNNNKKDASASMYALFSEFDMDCCTVDIDFIYIDSDDKGVGDGTYLGLSSVQRFGFYNTSFRFLSSKASKGDSAAVSTGSLLFAETSVSPTGTSNNLYLNAFAGFDKFASASRGEDASGPLGRTGILYAGQGLGQYGSALGNQADNAIGVGLGYQMFSKNTRRQVIVELGSRQSTKTSKAASAVGVRFQQAYGKRHILVLDGFVSNSTTLGTGNGFRVELRSKF